MSETTLYETLKALVEATEAADNPADYGVSSDAPPMLKAREALKEYELEYSCARGFGYFRIQPPAETASTEGNVTSKLFARHEVLPHGEPIEVTEVEAIKLFHDYPFKDEAARRDALDGMRSGATINRLFGRLVVLRGKCIANDATCPCQDGDMCHYKGPNPWPIPKTV